MTAMAPCGGLYVSHIRYKKGLLPALQEAMEIGRRAGVKVHVSHLKAPDPQTAEQFGYQHPRLDTPPLNPAWVQIDLRSAQPIDWIALVPAQLDWQSFDRPAYGFPKRFRIDISDDAEFLVFTTVADFTESDFPEPGIAPVAVRVSGQSARYVRVTVTKFALENGQYFFALAELMVDCATLPRTLERHVALVVREHEQNGRAGIAARIAGDARYREECAEWPA